MKEIQNAVGTLKMAGFISDKNEHSLHLSEMILSFKIKMKKGMTFRIFCITESGTHTSEMKTYVDTSI